MCCVIGYVGHRFCKDLLLEGLLRLEYRGYDSAGIALHESDALLAHTCKVTGSVEHLVEKLKMHHSTSTIGIGHTRWSTHGLVNEANAHPLTDCTKRFLVVHNGVISNYQSIKARLSIGGKHTFASDTDTEVIAHLCEELFHQSAHQPLSHLIRLLSEQLQGAFACVILLADKPDIIIAMRKSSPLCIGAGQDEYFVVSDPLACAGYAQRILFMPDESFAIVSKTGYKLYSFQGEQLLAQEEPLLLNWEGGTRQGFEHHMLKEIFEQPKALTLIAQQTAPALLEWLSGKEGVAFSQADAYTIIGCGTSLIAGALGQFFLEGVTHTPCLLRNASDMRDRPCLTPPHSWCIALSQSGETADTLQAMRMLQAQKIATVAITNRTLSSMAREADASLYLHVGTEVAVASTKTFTAHIAILYLLAYAIAQRKGQISEEVCDLSRDYLREASTLLHETIMYNRTIIDIHIAPFLAKATSCMILGRGLGFPLAQELALKLKELAYLHAEAFLGGELKHGSLALVDELMPLIVCSTLETPVYERLVANVHEICARKGKVISCAFAGQNELIQLGSDAIIISVPRDYLLGPLVMAGVLQYLAYRVAYERKLPIDKPRNLAKAVTVE